MSVAGSQTVAQDGERRSEAALPSATTAQRLRYGLKISLREPTTLIGILTALLFAYLILVPIISMLMDAGRVQFGDERRTGLELGALTQYYFNRTSCRRFRSICSGSRCSIHYRYRRAPLSSRCWSAAFWPG